MVSYYAGCDVGSTEVRVGLLNEQGELQLHTSEPISYHHSQIDSRFVTQSSTQIWAAFEKCWITLGSQVPRNSIKSIAFAATCSMVVMKQIDDELVPYPADYGFQDHDQNVVFWMDSRASEEAKKINNILRDDQVLKYYGGSFISEMGVPKVKYLIDHIPQQVLKDIVFFDLHDFLAFMFAQGGYCINTDFVASNSLSQRALDGGLKGWSASFLSKIGLDHLGKDGFKAIGKVEPTAAKHYSTIPLAGAAIAKSRSVSISQGVIDSYAGWIGSCGKDVQNSLTMVAGTSTCYLIGHKSINTIKGIWGPYEGIFPDLYASEGGQSTTGKLLEHLFVTHPAYSKLLELGDDVYKSLDDLIIKLEKESGESIHLVAKYCHFYGDLSGNRTPYGDSSMRGVFFGESVDTSINDLVLKYVTILEFLAFQTRQVVELMEVYEVQKIVICGSQGKNKRLVKLIADVVGLPVEVSSVDPQLAGVKGAAYIGACGYKGIPLLEVIRLFNKTGEVIQSAVDDNLDKLLNAKYRIMLDIAERQLLYNSWVDDSL